jgi:hypothetical protein
VISCTLEPLVKLLQRPQKIMLISKVVKRD